MSVDGLVGSLRVALDSGRVELRLAEDYRHFPGCPLDDQCLAAGLDPDCGCTEFASVKVLARAEEAAEIVVDVPPSHYYSAALQNDDTQLELGCVVEIDCDAFVDCQLDPDTVGVPAQARAVLNYPGPPALPDLGIDLDLRSRACAMVEHAEQPSDWLEGPAEDLRGSVRLCSGCLGE